MCGKVIATAQEGYGIQDHRKFITGLLDAEFWFGFLGFFLGLTISFSVLEVLSCAEKVSLYPKASQQPAKTGIKRGKHCYVLLNSGEDEAKVNN